MIHRRPGQDDDAMNNRNRAALFGGAQVRAPTVVVLSQQIRNASPYGSRTARITHRTLSVRPRRSRPCWKRRTTLNSASSSRRQEKARLLFLSDDDLNARADRGPEGAVDRNR